VGTCFAELTKHPTKVRLNIARRRSAWQAWIQQVRKPTHCTRCTSVLPRHLEKCKTQEKEKYVDHKICFISQYNICLYRRLLRRTLASHVRDESWPTCSQCLLAKCLFFSRQTWWHSSVTSVLKPFPTIIELFRADKHFRAN